MMAATKKNHRSALERGKSYYAKGELRDAVLALREACDTEPHNPETWYRCGLALLAMRDYRGAIPFLEFAAKADPDSASAAYNLGVAYETQGRDQSAEGMHLRALSLLSSAIPWVNLGGIRYRRGDHSGAYEAHSRALEIDTTDPDQLGQRSFVRLLRGDYAVGFREYECRWQSAIVKATNWRPDGLHRWRGHDLAGKSLLVYAEQGIGDTVQMLRYLPYVVDRHAVPILVVPGPLVRVVEQFAAPFPVLPTGSDYLRSVRWGVSLMSLPGIFTASPAQVPWSGPYLTAPGTLDTSLVSRGKSRPLIGYSEYGNRDHMNDRDRSVPVKSRGIFPADTAFDWVSLDRAECVFDLRDIGDTMDVLAACDAVMTVDTATAHLAGAMGKTTVMLPPSSPEWRWGLDTTRTPWYPTMQLIRRRTTDDWPDAITRAHDALHAHFSISSWSR